MLFSLLPSFLLPSSESSFQGQYFLAKSAEKQEIKPQPLPLRRRVNIQRWRVLRRLHLHTIQETDLLPTVDLFNMITTTITGE
jgi:hypothetical protein